jgi:hypothetical protein
MFQLLTAAGLDYSPSAIERWVGRRPVTTLHREWLELVRDYTLYINLHIQVRPSWFSVTMILVTVRALFVRTVRMGLLRPLPSAPSVSLALTVITPPVAASPSAPLLIPSALMAAAPEYYPTFIQPLSDMPILDMWLPAQIENMPLPQIPDSIRILFFPDLSGNFMGV